MLRRLLALDAHRGRLIVHGLGWVVLAKAALAVPGASLPRRQRWLDRLARRLPAPPRCTHDDAAWAVTAAASRVPHTRCLEWALALRGLFVQAGVTAELRIGVAADGPRDIRAHAWLDVAGRTWSWGDTADYVVLTPRR